LRFFKPQQAFKISFSFQKSIPHFFETPFFHLITHNSPMENLEIIEHPDDNIVIFNKLTNRYFHVKFPDQIDVHGFRTLKARELLLDRLKRKDFSYTNSDAHHMTIQFLLVNKTRVYTHHQSCLEAFPDEWIDLEKYDLNENVVSYMDSLQRKIHKLTDTVEQLTSRIELLSDNLNDEISYRRRIDKHCTCPCSKDSDIYSDM